MTSIAWRYEFVERLEWWRIASDQAFPNVPNRDQSTYGHQGELVQYQYNTTEGIGMGFAIGLMSGTFRDWVDAALIRTGGRYVVERVASGFEPYAAGNKLLVADAGLASQDVWIVGFHEHALAHRVSGG